MRTQIAQNVYAQIKDIFEDKIFGAAIPQNIKLNEAQAEGLSIFDYCPNCKGAQTYMDLGKKIIKKDYYEQYEQSYKQDKKKNLKEKNVIE